MIIFTETMIISYYYISGLIQVTIVVFSYLVFVKFKLLHAKAQSTAVPM